jgi:hypothetical protein
VLDARNGRSLVGRDATGFARLRSLNASASCAGAKNVNRYSQRWRDIARRAVRQQAKSDYVVKHQLGSLEVKQLIYHPTAEVTFATNTFINVPTILQFDQTPLVSVVREAKLGYTTEFPLYHADGTYLAKVTGTRVYATSEGTVAGVKIRELPTMWVCTIDGRTAFEVRHQAGEAFRVQAELHTPTGYLVKVSEGPTPQLYSATGASLQVGGMTMVGNLFENCKIGVWVRSNGSVAVGVS